MRKKVLSILLVVALMVSMVVVGSIAVSANEKLEGSTIRFEAPESWGELKTTTAVYAYLYVSGGEEYAPWASRAIKMTRVDETREYTFDITKSPEEGDWNVVIFSISSGNQTFDLTISPACIGDTAYVTGETVENPVDSAKSAEIAAWRNTPYEASHVTITSLGNIVGVKFLPNETPESLVADWAANELYAPLATDEKKAQLTADLEVLYAAQPTAPPTEAPTTAPTTIAPPTEEPTTEVETTTTAPTEAPTVAPTEAPTEPETDPEEGVRIDEYGRIGGIPTPWKYGMPAKQDPTEAQPDWDGYYKIYYFEAPDEWLENDEYKEEGFEIGFYWYGGDEANGDWPGEAATPVAPMMYQQFLDENPSATDEEKAAKEVEINEEYGNIFCGIAPSYVGFIIWNNGIDKGLPGTEDYDEEKADKAFQTVDINVEDFTIYPEGTGLIAADFCGGITYLNGTMRTVVNPATGEEQYVPEVSWKYFNPLTGEMTDEALKDSNGEYVTELDSYGDEVRLNPFFDMDYSYNRPDAGTVDPPAPTPIPTEEPTDAPGKGTVDTSQDTTMFIVVFMGLLLAAGAVLVVRRKKSQG